MLAFAPVMWPEVISGMTQRDLMLVSAAGFFEAVYFSGLAGGYRAGDLSLVYPLARAVPAVSVTIGSTLLGRGDDISSWVWAGSGLIVAGTIVLPQCRFSDLRLSNYTSGAFLLAMLAAVGTTGYSLVDDQALRFLRSDHPEIHPAGVTLVYSFCQVIATAFWLGLLVLSRPAGRISFRISLSQWRHILPTGAFIALTYAVVLLALAFARDVSYVVAFRQASIPMGVAIGVLLFREPMPVPKFVGTAALLCGLVMIALA